ncbi:MAG: glutamate-5-semialdehyde dehydrogenase [Paludibacteraceae bacterium]|nr:glutamate-5-semialdehyde dehydrogenase [Paludibacteraceae bacterium]
MTNDWKERAKRAADFLTGVKEPEINALLLKLADEVEDAKNASVILAANKKDLARMEKSNPNYDRLQLTEKRLSDIANDMRKVATLPMPTGRVIEERVLPNGLRLRKVSVAFGVIGVIYEARPNVSFDVFSLCVKSGNACVLKGGTDAYESNRAIVDLIEKTLREQGMDEGIVTLMPAGRDATAELMAARGTVDLIIPRGGSGLINFVRGNSKVPVIETGAGVCNTYFDKTGDVEKGRAIVNNAKTRRVSVCNALDTLIIHEGRLNDLAAVCEPLAKNRVVIEADERSYGALEGKYPAELLEHATGESFGTEFRDYRMSIKTVGSLDEAIEHIGRYGSGHSESIVTEDAVAGETFQRRVDAACVYVNAPTSFSDGGQFGMGAEIGISTQKLHARGPMALPEMTTYKWLVNGDGQVRE